MICQNYKKKYAQHLFYPTLAALLTITLLVAATYAVKRESLLDFKKYPFKFNRISAAEKKINPNKISALIAGGELDAMFDTDGKVMTSIGAGNDFALDVAFQSDGKIVAAGFSQNEEALETALIRYNPDGSLDTSFGGDGKVTTPYGSHSRAFAVTIQADGKIVAVGDSGAPAAVFRYNTDGSLDTTFDGDGIVSLTFYGNDLAYAVSVQPDGKIVVAGYGEGAFLLNHTTDFALARLDTDGSLDTSFGTGGKVFTPISVGEIANALTIQPDGKIIAAGWTADYFSGGLAVVRYNPDGSFDSSFGEGGIVVTRFGGKGTYGGAEAVALQPDGKIVAAGYYASETELGYVLVRYNADGSRDTAFDGDGIVTISNEVEAAFFGVIIQSNGKIAAAGGNLYASSAGINDFVVFRCNSDGSPDTSFGIDGTITTDFADFDDSADAIALQPDGKMVAAGFANNGKSYDFALSRYIGEAIVPRRTLFDFDGDSRADIAVFRAADRVWYLNQSTAGFFAAQFGLSTDKPAAADYDGDGKTDIAVFRGGIWYWLNSSNGNFNAIQFGLAGDKPVAADYTGDGRAELAVYRDGVWWSRNLSDNQISVVQFGFSTDRVLPADFDGDGKTDQSVYRGNGEWHLNRSGQGYTVVNFGLATDKPIIGDYDGDGQTDLAVFRPPTGDWWIQKSSNGSVSTTHWGLSTDKPVAADYDGDGRTDIAVYRDGTWYIIQSSTGGFLYHQFGLSSDIPVAGANVQ